MMRSLLTTILLYFPILSPAANKVAVIDQLEKIAVNGSEQYLLYRSNNSDRPVALFVHGGPGSPLMLFSRAFDKTDLNDFIVVHWDQRNTGKSYDPALALNTFTAEQVAADGLVVVEHLKKKFGQSKILLVGHSWGSIIGAFMVKKRPADFLAYISVGTVVDLSKADALKYEFLKSKIDETGDAKDKADLITMQKPPWKDFSQIIILSRLMTKYKGSFFSLSGDEINAAVEKTSEYTAADMKNLNLGMQKIWPQISPFLFSYNAMVSVPEIDVPLVFAQGNQDMATPTILAKAYFNQILAPKGKQWVEFPRSAHFPMYEEPKAFLELMKKAVR